MVEFSIIASGVMAPEGPVDLCNDTVAYVSTQTGVVGVVDLASRLVRTLCTLEAPNGMAMRKDRSLWVADAVGKLYRVTMEGQHELVTTGSKESPFLLPNDLCFGPDGYLYMTDSGILHETLGQTDPTRALSLPFNGKLYRIHPDEGTCSVLDTGLLLTNGIAFGPGGHYLYVAETVTGNIYRYKTGIWKRMYFGNVMIRTAQEVGQIIGPDGMAFSETGDLYVAVVGQGDITVLSPSGQVINRIAIRGTHPTNLAFDTSGEKRIFVTEASRGALLEMKTSSKGLPLFA